MKALTKKKKKPDVCLHFHTMKVNGDQGLSSSKKMTKKALERITCLSLPYANLVHFDWFSCVHDDLNQ